MYFTTLCSSCFIFTPAVKQTLSSDETVVVGMLTEMRSNYASKHTCAADVVLASVGTTSALSQ